MGKWRLHWKPINWIVTSNVTVQILSYNENSVNGPYVCGILHHLQSNSADWIPLMKPTDILRNVDLDSRKSRSVFAHEVDLDLNNTTNNWWLLFLFLSPFIFRYDLLPFYSRLVATLYPCMPDVANDLVHLLKGDFRWHVSALLFLLSFYLSVFFFQLWLYWSTSSVFFFFQSII